MSKCPLVNIYLLEFVHKVGNGWAFVGALTPKEAERIFYGETNFKNPKVEHFRAMPIQGGEIGMIYEGGIVNFKDNNDRQIYDDFCKVTGYKGTYNQWLLFLNQKDSGEVHIDIDSELSNQSENPVQNKVITEAVNQKVDSKDYLTYWNVNKIVFNAFGF